MRTATKYKGATVGFLMQRDDIQPVILGGDMSSYPMAREFYEAFGVSSIVVAMDAISVIKKSRFISLHVVSDNECETIAAAIEQISLAHADKKIVLITNTDDRVEVVERIQDGLPQNVVAPLPPHDLMKQVSDKVVFQRMCNEYGIETPLTEVVNLAGDAPIKPAKVPFPLVAKPAASSEYAHLYAKGFQKVYFIHGQSELDRLWSDLRAVGFAGDILVQELIEGDDTYMDSLTLYVSTAGKVTLFSSAQVLLEDHVPALFGNPVAMITKPLPEQWEQAERLLLGIGWRGFANIDLKRDPKTGRKLFLDMNPRIGANSYYTCAAGINPMYVLVRDVIDGVPDEVRKIDRSVLYKRVPVSLARKYVRQKQLLDEFDSIVSSGAVVNPTRCKADTIGSQLAGFLMEKNYIRKFTTYYPEATDTSF